MVTDCVDVSGNDMVRQPDNSLVLSPTYRSRIGSSDWNWSARLDMRYTSKEWIDTLNSASLPSTTIFNASVSFRNENWLIRLYGNNLGDDDTPRMVRFFNDPSIGRPPAGERNYRIFPRTPREIGISVTYDY